MNIPLTLSGYPAIARERDLRREYDLSSARQKILNIGLSLLRELSFGIQQFMNRHSPSRFHFHRCDKKIHWKKASKGLYVFIHGLYCHPLIWKSHLLELERYPQFDIFAPYVPYTGLCKLEEAAQPILHQILDYLKIHPQRPICLIGFSNGSRIATWLEIQLRHLVRGTAVKVSTIAGVHFGSSLVNRLERYGLARWILHRVIRQELAFGCQKAQDLLKDVLQKCPEDTERSYDFFATTEDFIVPSLNTSLPRLGLGEGHYVVSGFGHNSVVAAVSVPQMQLCNDWMERQQTTLRSKL